MIFQRLSHHAQRNSKRGVTLLKLSSIWWLLRHWFSANMINDERQRLRDTQTAYTFNILTTAGSDYISENYDTLRNAMMASVIADDQATEM